jgi:hypothetical protein
MEKFARLGLAASFGVFNQKRIGLMADKQTFHSFHRVALHYGSLRLGKSSTLSIK